MDWRKCEGRLEALEEEVWRLIAFLPSERDLAAYLRAYPNEDLLTLANGVHSLLLIFLRQRGYDDDPPEEVILSYLCELSGRPYHGSPPPPPDPNAQRKGGRPLEDGPDIPYVTGDSDGRLCEPAGP